MPNRQHVQWLDAQLMGTKRYFQVAVSGRVRPSPALAGMPNALREVRRPAFVIGRAARPHGVTFGRVAERVLPGPTGRRRSGQQGGGERNKPPVSATPLNHGGGAGSGERRSPFAPNSISPRMARARARRAPYPFARSSEPVADTDSGGPGLNPEYFRTRSLPANRQPSRPDLQSNSTRRKY
jgi:hypothetical protein